MFKAIAQKNPMGCGIACVTCVANTTYSRVIKLVSLKSAFTRGYYCKDIINALKKIGLKYDYKKVTSKTKKYLKKKGTIVFIKRSSKYPKGHYLAKTNRGWMNPWINYPKMPVRAGFNKKLPGKAQWVIFQKPSK